MPRDAKQRRSRENIRGDTMVLVGWSDAVYRDQSSLGKCRLGYVIGLTPPNLCGPCHITLWTSKFARRMVKSCLGGDVYALSEMPDHASVHREVYGRFVDLFPVLVGPEACESLFAKLLGHTTGF